MIQHVKLKVEYEILKRLNKYGQRIQFINHLEQNSRPVFIYQMGKVGSQSVRHSLESVYKEPVIQGHGFSYNFHNWKPRILYRFFQKGNPLDIITLTREPVSRNVSHFFQKYKGSLSNSLEVLKKEFLEQYDHHMADRWFQDHIQKSFGIDVYTKKIPDCGYQIYEKGRVRLLLIKIETENEIIESAIRSFLNMEDFSLQAHNVGTKKKYGQVYKSFVDNVRFSEQYINEVLSGQYFKHFYNNHTAEAVLKKWCQ